MVETYYPLIEQALAVVDEELEIATAEQRAFEQFRSQLSEINPAQTLPRSGASATGNGTMSVTGQPRKSPSASLKRVRTAYRETVMSVAHFESEYGDTLGENIAAEFGADLASQVSDGQILIRTVHEALMAATESAIEERRQYGRNLEEERESLREIQAGVGHCEQRAYELGDAVDEASGSDALATLDAQFGDLEATCEELVTERQQLIHGRRSRQISGIDRESLTTFLYGDFEITCPGLAEIVRCLDTLRSRRRRCLRR